MGNVFQTPLQILKRILVLTNLKTLKIALKNLYKSVLLTLDQKNLVYFT